MRALVAYALLGLVLCAGGVPARAKDKQQEKQNAAHAGEIGAAQAAADDWLKLLDAEKYPECWRMAAGGFQANVPQAAWERRMGAVRKPLDPVITRTLNTAEYKTALPGLPPGVYVALVWETVFSNGRAKLESVVMAGEGGGGWKMTGYAVQ